MRSEGWRSGTLLRCFHLSNPAVLHGYLAAREGPLLDNAIYSILFFPDRVPPQKRHAKVYELG